MNGKPGKNHQVERHGNTSIRRESIYVCRIGKMEEVMEYAQKIAEENGVTVEVVI